MTTHVFDADDYLSRYPEVAALGLDPLDHFEKFGKRMGYGNRGSAENCSSLEIGIMTQPSEHETGCTENGGLIRFQSHSIAHLSGQNFLDMKEVIGHGVPVWASIGSDPQMILQVSGQRLGLTPGKYLVYFSVEEISGALLLPKLYLDFGDGFSEAKGTTLDFVRVQGQQAFYCVLELNAALHQIRFDPSVSAFETYLTSFLIEEFDTRRSVAPIQNPPMSKLWILSQLQAKGAPTENIYEATWRTGLDVATGARSPEYAPLTDITALPNQDGCMILAFYLPQFHPIRENDAWWGHGFTEWTNVSKAQPQFLGHNQPRLPGELGFYDLRLPDVMKRQIELARQFGIAGFCFHYYWFAGKRLLERPVEAFLENKSEEFDFPFCLCWANENWTRKWDGSESDVLIAQDHSDQDNRNVFQDLLRFFKDSRYILVDGKPMITIYRPGIITGLEALVSTWRAAALEAGFEGIYLVTTNAFGCDDASAIGFDALVEFPPHGVASTVLNDQLDMLNDRFEGQVYEYQQVVDFSTDRLNTLKSTTSTTGYFPTVMTGWDNEARMPGKGHIFHGATPRKFQCWLSAALEFSKAKNSKSERFVFVNAWNEWGEGTYLEPDRHFGYAYLNAVVSALNSVIT